MHTKKISGFTLVELIVVITILSILGTIAFLSFQSYPASARNSNRLADITNIETALSIYKIKIGEYPEPTNIFNVTYSGATAWSQGTFGESTFVNLSNLSSLPVDPLTNNEYTYSVTNSRGEYQIAGIQEDGGFFSYSNNQSYANDQVATAYVSGDYNGKIITVHKNLTDYILAVPSIITSDSSDISLQDILTHDSLVVNGRKNAPSSYTQTYAGTGGVDYHSSVEDVVVFSGSISDLNTDSVRQTYATTLQNAYSGSIFSSDENYIELTSASSQTALNLITNSIAHNEGGIVVKGIDHNDIVAISTGDNSVGNSIETNLSLHLIDINSSGGSYPENLVTFNGEVFFSAVNASGNREIMKSDGSTFSEVTAFNGGDITINSLTPYNGELYFTAKADAEGNEIWKTNGTTTTRVTNINTSGDSVSGGLIEYNSDLYFHGTNGSDSELYKTNGTTTSLAHNINPSSNSYPSLFQVFNGELYFRAQNDTTGFKMWKTDGTTLSPITYFSPSPGNDVNGHFFFTGQEAAGIQEIWKTDGTTLTQVTNYNLTSSNAPSSLLPYNNEVYFSMNNSAEGKELWKTDGVNPATRVTNINTSGDSNPYPMIVYNNELYFIATDGINGTELWKTDGSTTSRISSEIPFSTSSSIVFEGEMYFIIDDFSTKIELWKTNGVTSTLVEQIENGYPGFNYPGQFIVLGKKLFFVAYDSTNGQELRVLKY